MSAVASAPHWHEITDLGAWDAAVGALGAHPLQSALWGEARRKAEGIACRYWGVDAGAGLVALARVEDRRAPVLGTLAWIPRGPVVPTDDYVLALQQQLRQNGYIMMASSSWQRVDDVTTSNALPRTIWIDLRVGSDQLQQNLDSQWRYGARRSLREGVVIEQTTDEADVAVFFELCAGISAAKGFRLPGSLALMLQLLRDSQPTAPVQARLFVARQQRELVAGAFVMSAGKRVHYLWGGVDRRHARLRAGEAVQWAVMEWAVQQGHELYDLEGIDPVNNPGTYEFKKKMGGVEVALAAETRQPLNWRGQLALQALRLRQRGGS